MECFLLNSIGQFLLSCGVLHKSIFYDPMEYSICQLFNAVWSASFSTPLVNFYCLVEYSISQFFTTLWSTPYVYFLMPYGVLHNQLNSSVFKAMMRTPYVLFLETHGVLHMSAFWYHMECFIMNSTGHFLLPCGKLHLFTF